MRDSWSWLEDLWYKKWMSDRTKGILLVAIPLFIIIAGGAYWLISIMPMYTLAGGSIVTVHITNPPSNFLNPTAQIIVGLGVCLASISWGVAKIIKSLK